MKDGGESVIVTEPVLVLAAAFCVLASHNSVCPWQPIW
jgi:hypothetical protein